MKYELKNKVVLITGGAVGLGKGLVKEAINKGAIVYFCDILKKEGLALQNELQEQGKQAHFIECNIANYNEVEAMFHKIMLEQNRLDVLINNAAKQTIATIDDMGYEEFKSVIDVNLNGVFYCMKNAAKHMKQRSVILNILSIYWNNKARVDKYHYDAAKAGVGSLTRNFAMALTDKGISVNGIYPGFLITPMNGDIVGEELNKSLAKNRIKETDASSVKGFSEYVISFIEDFSYGVTGQVLGVEAGRSL